MWSLVRIQSPRLIKRLGNLMIIEPFFRSLAVDFIRWDKNGTQYLIYRPEFSFRCQIRIGIVVGLNGDWGGGFGK